jgi:hypothetical protein
MSETRLALTIVFRVMTKIGVAILIIVMATQGGHLGDASTLDSPHYSAGFWHNSGYDLVGTRRRLWRGDVPEETSHGALLDCNPSRSCYGRSRI